MEDGMCWVCDHPDATRLDQLRYVRGVLDEHCWVVVGVARERYRPPYSYTVGLTDHGLPEIVVTGLSPERAAELLNDAAASAVDDGTPPVPGGRVRLRGGRPGEVVGVAEPWVHLGVAAEMFEARLRAVQLVYADSRGLWPWDAGFRGGRGGQPVLGARAIVKAA
jgi:Domain of unknown function (DUF4262)